MDITIAENPILGALELGQWYITAKLWFWQKDASEVRFEK